jgi:hypothetical protein
VLLDVARAIRRLRPMQAIVRSTIHLFARTARSSAVRSTISSVTPRCSRAQATDSPGVIWRC